MTTELTKKMTKKFYIRKSISQSEFKEKQEKGILENLKFLERNFTTVFIFKTIL